MNGNRWADDEKAILRADYRTVPTREIALRLGRSSQAVYQRMLIDGLTTQRIRFTGAQMATIRERNAQGYSDVEIAAELGCDRHCVTKRRKGLGLPSNANSARIRARVAEKTRRQCEAAGVSSLGEYRALMYRVRAIKAGWPSDIRWRGVQILELLRQRGPLTREQIAEGIGVPWKGSRASLCSNDREGSYLANLVRRGLVIRLGRIVGGRGRSRNVNLYDLAMNAERKDAK